MPSIYAVDSAHINLSLIISVIILVIVSPSAA